jgi:hypothetical protein
LRYSPLVNNNFAINGSFDWWQRGTSFTGLSDYYTADRWQGYRGGAAAGGTWSRQTASLDGFTYSMRVQRNSANASTAAMVLATSYETTQVRNLQGQYLTLSFWAKVGANFSSASSAISVGIRTGTGTDGNLASGFTSPANAVLTSVTGTTSWQRFSVTTTSAIASTVTQLGFDFQFTPVGTASTNDWFEIAGVQLEVGQVSTSWKRCGATLQGELAACQRYFYKTGGGTDASDSLARVYPLGVAHTTTQMVVSLAFPQSLRIVPTAVSYSGIRAYDGASVIAVTSMTFVAASLSYANIALNAASGFTIYRPTFPAQDGASGFISFSAEL